MNVLTHLFTPFWSSTTQDRETLFFYQRKDGEPSWARLLFPPDKILSVRSSNGKTACEEEKDFALDKKSGVLRLLPGSKIPFKTPGEIYPPAASNLPKYAHKRGDPATHLIFGEGHFFHDLQVDVTYTHAPGLWKGPVPRFQGGNLPAVLGKLRRKAPISLFTLGDSITSGSDASKKAGVAPFQPYYGELVALGLEKAFGAKVKLRNFGVGGWTSADGLAGIDLVTAATKPDLVIIAFGMNDACGNDAAKLGANVRAMMDRIRAVSPEAEFVLVAPMLPNAEWSVPRMENFPLIRDALAGLCGPFDAAQGRPEDARMGGKGAVLADVTSVWAELLKRKSFLDLTGNGVNHPNDFGHRIYAQTILALLVPPDAATGAGAMKEQAEQK